MLARLNEYRLRMKNLTDVFEGRVPRVLIIGLDGAGKTSLLYKAKLDNTIYANVPPRGINIEHMRPKRGCRIQMYDMPGSKITRHLWHNWFKASEALVYVVDSSDRVRIDESKFELHELLQSRHLTRVPLIVVANKQDEESAMATDEIIVELELTTIENRDWSIHATSAHKGTGVKATFIDTVEKIKAFRHYKSGLVPKPKTARKSSKSSDGSGKKIEADSEPHFTSIEDTDINDNDDTSTKIPSLFEALKNSEKVTDLDAESDVVAGTSTSSNDQPEYDRPRMSAEEQSASDKDDRNSSGEDKNPSPDTISETTPSVDMEQIQYSSNARQTVEDEHEFETRASIHSSSTDSNSGTDNVRVRDVDSVKDAHVPSLSRDTSLVDSDGDCVQNLEDIVREEEMNRTEEV